MFSMEEATALAFGLLMTRRLGMGIDPVSVEGALAKLERVLPTEVKGPVHAIEETLQVELNLPDRSPNQQVVSTLSLAVQQRKRVVLHYQALRGSLTERSVDPYGVLFRNGYWYMAGYCHLRDDLRSFRLDRVEGVAQIDEPFIRPEEFDLLDYIERSISQTPGTWTVDVILHTTLEEAECMIPRAVGTPQQRDDDVLLRAYVQSLDWFAYFLAGLDCPLKVLGPPEAQVALRELSNKLAEMADGP